MRAYLIRRFILVIPTMLGVAFIVFLLIQLVPGSAVEQMLAEMDQQYKEAKIEEIKEAMGINVPIHIQFLRWVWGIVRGDFGESLWTGTPVLDQIINKLPVSFELGFLAMILSLLIAIPIGIYSAIRQDTWGDYVTRSFAILALAMPSFWMGTIIMIYPSIWWDWSPPMEYIPFSHNPLGNLAQFAIPSVILGLHMTGTTMRITRTMMLEVLRQDYIRTAWSKGLQEKAVVLRHAMKNALLPVVTVVGLQIPILIGGSVVMEQIFNLPGIGRHLVLAIGRRDYIVIAGLNIFVAVAILLANMIVDLTYAYLDPRIRYE